MMEKEFQKKKYSLYVKKKRFEATVDQRKQEIESGDDDRQRNRFDDRILIRFSMDQ